MIADRFVGTVRRTVQPWSSSNNLQAWKNAALTAFFCAESNARPRAAPPLASNRPSISRGIWPVWPIASANAVNSAAGMLSDDQRHVGKGTRGRRRIRWRRSHDGLGMANADRGLTREERRQVVRAPFVRRISLLEHEE